MKPYGVKGSSQRIYYGSTANDKELIMKYSFNVRFLSEKIMTELNLYRVFQQLLKHRAHKVHNPPNLIIRFHFVKKLIKVLTSQTLKPQPS